MAGGSQRQLRVGEQIRHCLSETLQRGHFQNPILFKGASMVSVSEVRISPDLKNATAYVRTLGGSEMKEMVDALNDAAGYFQKELGRSMNMKFTPRVRFVIDTSFDEAAKIENILKQISPKD